MCIRRSSLVRCRDNVIGGNYPPARQIAITGRRVPLAKSRRPRVESCFLTPRRRTPISRRFNYRRSARVRAPACSVWGTRVRNAVRQALRRLRPPARAAGALNEGDVTEALREVRLALLDADVALPVVKDFIAKVRERAVGQEVLDSVSPGQQVVKIVNDVMIEQLGGAGAVPLNLNAAAPVPILMVGLQGSGKTTTSGKLALRFQAADAQEGAAGQPRHPAPRRPAAACSSLPTQAGVAQPAHHRRPDPAADRPPRHGHRAGARCSTSSSSTPPAGCRSTRR